MGDGEILTLPEVASLLRIAPKTVYTLAQRRQIPAFKVGGQWRFGRSAIQAWIDERTQLAAGDATLTEIVRRLVAVYRPEHIYLFGSRARGDAGPDSDYDLMVVVPDEAEPARRSSRLGYEALWGVGAAVDVVVCTRAWFDARLHLKASFPSTIVREGRLLHAA